MIRRKLATWVPDVLPLGWVRMEQREVTNRQLISSLMT